jgi:hypothetical protein
VHLNYKSLSLLNSNEMVVGMPSIKIPEQAYGTCLIGKQTILAFNSSLPMRATHVLNVVHSDVCGPMHVPKYGGNRYFITFVDEFSRMMWLYVMKTKNEAFEIFL